ncbi:MAG: hypothetical protein IPP16_21010 [Acidimicrobiaceae bacterium]|nr:hypothetical protein [Acidimicrobiaceae bacterium]
MPLLVAMISIASHSLVAASPRDGRDDRAEEAAFVGAAGAERDDGGTDVAAGATEGEFGLLLDVAVVRLVVSVSRHGGGQPGSSEHLGHEGHRVEVDLGSALLAMKGIAQRRVQRTNRKVAMLYAHFVADAVRVQPSQVRSSVLGGVPILGGPD